MGNEIQTVTYYPLDGTPENIRKTYASPLNLNPGTGVYDGSSEMVSWVRFIDALHSMNADTRASLTPTKRSEFKPDEDWGGFMIPMVTAQNHSWDFVPPDVIRPLAVMTLQDIAVFSRRLGMIWKQFEPSQGSLHAEGNGHTVDSTFVRSVGTVAQFSIRDPLNIHNPKEHLYIPSKAADMMGFGILTGDKRMGMSDYVIGTIDDCLARCREIDVAAGDKVKQLNADFGPWTPGISDIIALAAPMIRIPGSTIIKVPKPTEYEGGLTLQEEGFVVFYNRLRDVVHERQTKGQYVSQQKRWVLTQYEELLSRYGKQWEDQTATRGNDTSLAFLDDLHARHDLTTKYFCDLQASHGIDEKGRTNSFRYTDLINSHIKHAVSYYNEAVGLLDAGKGRNHYGMKVQAWITEGAHVYFDNIPKIVASMKQQGFHNPQVVEEAWLTMMFRAFLWHRTHLMVGGNRVPSQHWGSRLTVYVG